ncbi:MAG: penicillin-binding protein 2 [Actinobacteria bacterium]|nr:penicillin-binding protein 2 [Actinomycetota bacterium]
MDKKRYDKKNNYIKRSFWIFLSILLSFIFLIYRVVVIQAINPKYFIKKSEIDLTQKKPIPAKRGDIEDTNGNKLAVTIPVKRICTNPYYLKDKERVARIIAKYLKIDYEKVKDIFEKNSNKYVVLARNVSIDTAEKIVREARENMLWMEDDFIRIYPNGTLASHVIGFVVPSAENGYLELVGKEGAEYYFNDLLKGTPGYIEAQFYSNVGAIVPETIKKKQEAKDGKNLVLTIDKEIQFFVEQALKEAIKEQEAKGACAMVINSKTGEIYAMASLPDFDPNSHGKVDDISYYINKCYRAVYEPGSTFKTITIAAAINEQLISPQTIMYLPEKLKIGRYTIKEAHHRPAGSYNVIQILQESMNIGAVKIAEKLGPERFYEYVTCFGFGRKTGLDLSGEQVGRVLPTDQWKKTTLATMSFGQGISCTPLQMLMATNVFANNGYYVEPHIFKYSYDPETGSQQFRTESKQTKIVSDKTVEIMKKMLEEVVNNGTGQKAKVYGYRVAGKTGTAQVPGKTGYQRGKYISSFVGFLPVSDPRLTIMVVVYEPKKAHYGGTVAAPVFSRIAEFCVKYLKVPPDKSEKEIDSEKTPAGKDVTGD